MAARVLGTAFEDETYGKIEKYYRITALNSEENRKSVIDMCRFFQGKGTTNLVLRVTLDKNDFELVIFDQLKTAVFCFHDFNRHDVVHSCLITRDEGLYVYFEQLYEKIWREDSVLEIDFSLGDQAVEEKIKLLASLPAGFTKEHLSPIEGIRLEAQNKIAICAIIEKGATVPGSDRTLTR